MSSFKVPTRTGEAEVELVQEIVESAWELPDNFPSEWPGLATGIELEQPFYEARIAGSDPHRSSTFGIQRAVHLWLPKEMSPDDIGGLLQKLELTDPVLLLGPRGLYRARLDSSFPLDDAWTQFTERIENMSDVSAEVDALGRATFPIETPEDNPPGSHELPWHIEDAGIPELWAVAGQGEGTRIGVIDLWFNEEHASLAGKVSQQSTTILAAGQRRSLGYASLYEQALYPYLPQAQRHGTLCAAIAAGRDYKTNGGARFSGVAPEATLVLVRVEAILRGGYRWVALSTIARAIREAANNSDVVSLSFLGDYRQSLPSGWSEALAEQLEAAVWSNGESVPIFCAVGNEPESRLDERLVVNHYETFAIGAARADMSRRPGDRGRELELLGAGEAILCADALTRDELHWASGSSCAAPWVAGLAAILIGARRKLRAELPRSELVDQLRRASTHYSAPDDESGYGFVQPRNLALAIKD